MGNTFFVVDDNIPIAKTGADDRKPINTEDIRKLVEQGGLWEEKTLLGLFENLVGEEAQNQVTGFTNPEFCLKDLRRGASPEIIIYDWDYPVGDSKALLLDILRKTKQSVAIGIYTRYDRHDEISAVLQSTQFARFAKRLEIFRKDDDRSAPPQVITKIKAIYEGLKAATLGRSRRRKSPEKAVTFRVWYGTNRKPLNPDILTTGFGSERDTRINYGTAQVIIPESHTFGRTGSAWTTRFLKGDDDRLSVKALNPLAESDFWARMKPAFKVPPAEERSALVFVHGYNVKFNDAVVRAAQIGFDLKLSGPTALFSWPSKGTLTDYLADHDSVEYSEDYLAEFLIKMVTQSGSNRIHIIAHSMGNRGLLKCLGVVLQKLKKTTKLRFGQIFLAAPDIDADLFGQLCGVYKKLGQRTTLYVSSKDKALAASSRFRGKQRVGFGPPILTFDDIDTIDVSHLDLTFLAHSYYAEAAEVIYDIFDALKGNPPEKRLRLARCPAEAGRCYWRVKK